MIWSLISFPTSGPSPWYHRRCAQSHCEPSHVSSHKNNKAEKNTKRKHSRKNTIEKNMQNNVFIQILGEVSLCSAMLPLKVVKVGQTKHVTACIFGPHLLARYVAASCAAPEAKFDKHRSQLTDVHKKMNWKTSKRFKDFQGFCTCFFTFSGPHQLQLLLQTLTFTTDLASASCSLAASSSSSTSHRTVRHGRFFLVHGR